MKKQSGIRLEPELKDKALAKAAKIHLSLSEVARRLLWAWVEGKIKLPSPED